MEKVYLHKFLQKFQYLKIQLEEIKKATNNFNDKRIGVGGFGNVYKGEVSHSEGRGLVAIKRLNLNPKNLQGTPEFLKEITMLSDLKHENVISLLGFCCEGGEMILVYELASRGSLNQYLKSPHLTWTQRLKICLDAAKGLSYLHDPRETHRRLIHCDVKSANILLDDQWNAKVSDLGLSIIGSANEQHSVVVTLAAGTVGYIDPQYLMTHTLTKESDVFSFGAVLFEVLCGTLCYTLDSSGHVENILAPTWKECYEQKKLHDIIFEDPNIQAIDHSALETFSDIAYRCLKESREDRPTMAEVVNELETALERQELSEGKLPLFIYEEMTKTAESPMIYSSKTELWELLSEGVLLNGGKTLFSLNKKGEHCEMISFAECLDLAPSEFDRCSSAYNSRFAGGTYHYKGERVKTRVRTKFLSPGITYAVNLVFKFESLYDSRKFYSILLKYKLQGEAETSISYLAYERGDGWWMCELYQFISDQRTVDLEILFDGFNRYHYEFMGVEGIEFQPLEKVEYKDEKQPISDSDANWEEKLPTDYEDIMKWSKNSVQWTTKKDAYSIIRKGFLINDGQEWFSIDKNGKKCYMLSARSACIWVEDTDIMSYPESRFGEAVKRDMRSIGITKIIQSHLLSSQTTYAAYLVYKLPEYESTFEHPLEVENRRSDSYNMWYIYLVSPQTPVIRPKTCKNTDNPLNRPKLKGLPKQRNDGWMEVQIWGFQTTATTKMIDMGLVFLPCGPLDLDSVFIVQGIEFRPI